MVMFPLAHVFILCFMLLSGCGIPGRFTRILLAGCVIEYVSQITVENNLDTDVTLLYNEIEIDGDDYVYEDYIVNAFIPAGETVKARGQILVGIGAVPKVFLKALDSSGKVVWEGEWSGSEYYDLTIDGFYIVLNS